MPSRRIYVDKDSIPRVMGGYGTAVISTSKGVLTDKECRSMGVGGEVICHIW
jgi:small subunit ribosomal protein S8